jgi:hypothetical protein
MADGFIILRANSIFKQNETNANGAKLAKLIIFELEKLQNKKNKQILLKFNFFSKSHLIFWLFRKKNSLIS